MEKKASHRSKEPRIEDENEKIFSIIKEKSSQMVSLNGSQTFNQGLLNESGDFVQPSAFDYSQTSTYALSTLEN